MQRLLFVAGSFPTAGNQDRLLELPRPGAALEAFHVGFEVRLERVEALGELELAKQQEVQRGTLVLVKLLLKK